MKRSRETRNEINLSSVSENVPVKSTKCGCKSGSEDDLGFISHGDVGIGKEIENVKGKGLEPAVA